MPRSSGLSHAESPRDAAVQIVRVLRQAGHEAYFAGGRIQERGTYRGGDFDGPRAWYIDGRLLERVTYADGQIDGPYERYAADGTLQLQGTLRHGNPCGVWIEGGARVVYPSCGYVGG